MPFSCLGRGLNDRTNTLAQSSASFFQRLRCTNAAVCSPERGALRRTPTKPEEKERGDPTVCAARSEEHTSELQSPDHLVCRLLLEKKKAEQSHQRPSWIAKRTREVEVAY